jgi:hypothetical protein
MLTLEQKEAHRLRCQKYREKNRERVRESQKKYCEFHKDKVLEYARSYYKNNKEYVSVRNKQYENRPDIKSARKIRKEKYYKEHKDDFKRRSDKHYEANREQLIKNTIEYHKSHPEVVKRAFDKYKKTDKARARYSKYAKVHTGRVNAKNKAREVNKIKRLPKWANLNKIKEIYENCPKGSVVDHIVPLQGKNVSGLHIETNLQYLTPEVNLRKGNKFNFDEYCQTDNYKNWLKNINDMRSRQYLNKVEE